VQQILVLSLIAAVDPVLLAAAGVMLLMPSPKRLMLGFVVGALLTSIPLGLVIVFALQDKSKPVSTTKHTVDPVLDLVVGGALLVIAVVVATGLWDRMKERGENRRIERHGPPKDKRPSRLDRALSKGSPRLTFCAGAVYEALPSVVYLGVMHEIIKMNARTVTSMLLVVLICVAQLAFVLVPLISFAVAPSWTPKALASAKAWLTRDSRKLVVWTTAIIGGFLVVRAIVALLV